VESPCLSDSPQRVGDRKRGGYPGFRSGQGPGGATLEAIGSCRDRDLNMEAMVSGALKIAHRLLRENRNPSILGVGGYTGSLHGGRGDAVLPSASKILVSSGCSLPGLSTRLIQTSDIVLFNSVVEIAGLTGFLKNVLDRAVVAMVGIFKGQVTEPSADRRKAIAL